MDISTLKLGEIQDDSMLLMLFLAKSV